MPLLQLLYFKRASRKYDDKFLGCYKPPVIWGFIIHYSNPFCRVVCRINLLSVNLPASRSWGTDFCGRKWALSSRRFTLIPLILRYRHERFVKRCINVTTQGLFSVETLGGVVNLITVSPTEKTLRQLGVYSKSGKAKASGPIHTERKWERKRNAFASGFARYELTLKCQRKIRTSKKSFTFARCERTFRLCSHWAS